MEGVTVRTTIAAIVLLSLGAARLSAQLPGDSVRVHRACDSAPCGAPLEARYVGWRVDTLLVSRRDSTIALAPGTVQSIDRWRRMPPGQTIAAGTLGGALAMALYDMLAGDGYGGHSIQADQVAAGAGAGLLGGIVVALIRHGRWERVPGR